MEVSIDSDKNIGYPIATMIILSYLSLDAFRPRYIVIWLPLLFVAVHLVIPHKEVRFLFPVVNLLPLVIVLGYQVIDEWAKTENNSISRSLVITISVVVIGINVIALAASVVTSPSYGRIAAVNFIDRRFVGQDIDLIQSGHRSKIPMCLIRFCTNLFTSIKELITFF